MLLFPKDNAPAKAPKRDITGVPSKRLVNKITKLSLGKNNKNTTVDDNTIMGKELKIQLTKIFKITRGRVETLNEKNISKEPSSKSSLNIFWIDNKVDKRTQIQVMPGAKKARSAGSLDNARG